MISISLKSTADDGSVTIWEWHDSQTATVWQSTCPIWQLLNSKQVFLLLSWNVITIRAELLAFFEKKNN